MNLCMPILKFHMYRLYKTILCSNQCMSYMQFLIKVINGNSVLSKGEVKTPVGVMIISIDPAINIKILCQHLETATCSNQCHN